MNHVITTIEITIRRTFIAECPFEEMQTIITPPPSETPPEENEDEE